MNNELINHPANVGKLVVSTFLVKQSPWLLMFLSEFKIIGYNSDGDKNRDVTTFLVESKKLKLIHQDEEIPYYSCIYGRNKEGFTYCKEIKEVPAPWWTIPCIPVKPLVKEPV